MTEPEYDFTMPDARAPLSDEEFSIAAEQYRQLKIRIRAGEAVPMSGSSSTNWGLEGDAADEPEPPAVELECALDGCTGRSPRKYCSPEHAAEANRRQARDRYYTKRGLEPPPRRQDRPLPPSGSNPGAPEPPEADN